MPELPDVEVFRQYLDSTSLHQPIESVLRVDRNMLWKISPRKFRSALKRKQIQSTRRHGKYVFAELKGGGSLGLHFGMSGSLKYFKDGDDAPPHTRVLVRFENGYHLACISVRKLGKVFVAQDVEAFIRKQELGPDAMAVNFETFHSIFRSRRGCIKTALMDQKVLAGLGNIYADEILFQSGIRPTRRCGKLGSEEWRRVFRVMRTVLRAVIRKRAQPDRFPKSYLTPHREPKATCPRCGSQLKHKKVGGRTTYFCPSEQK